MSMKLKTKRRFWGAVLDRRAKPNLSVLTQTVPNSSVRVEPCCCAATCGLDRLLLVHGTGRHLAADLADVPDNTSAYEQDEPREEVPRNASSSCRDEGKTTARRRT